MTIKEQFLYTRDSKDKIRLVTVHLEKEAESSYSIFRRSGLLNGKLIDQPTKTITKGKVNRTALEQAVLEYESIVNKQRDKGYKTYDELTSVEHDPFDYNFIDGLLPSGKTTTDGYKKPMLAQEAIKQKEEYLEQDFYISKKLDGVRTLVHLEENGDEEILVFKTRGGKVYQGVTTNFCKDVELINLIKKYKCEIDGEFYKHGMLLKDINGTCQLEKYTPERHDQIDFYIFDLADDSRTVKERVEILESLPEFSNPRVKVLEHILVHKSYEIYELHDEWVKEGYEGAMARTANSKYQFGKRTKDLIKFKSFQDDEFEIIGYEEGLRPIHDMVFILKTHDGSNTFKAKPQGAFQDKAKYIEDMDDIIGKMGTVKYQYLIEDTRIPFLPSFKSVRYDL